MKNKLYTVNYLGYKMWVLNAAGARGRIAITKDSFAFKPIEVEFYTIQFSSGKNLHYNIGWRGVSREIFKKEWEERKLKQKMKDMFND